MARVQITDETETRRYYVSGDFERDGEITSEKRSYDAQRRSEAIAMARNDGLVRLVSAYFGQD